MIISIVGPSQSGSTLVYNLIRLFYEKKGFKVISKFIYGKDINSLKKIINKNEIHIYKIHNYCEQLKKVSNKIILTIRDLRDTVSSALKRYPEQFNTFKKQLERAEQNQVFFNSWEPYANYIFKYEDYKKRPVIIANRLFKILVYS